jgi:hypothetical protein
MPGNGVPTFVQGFDTSYDPASVTNASQEIMPLGETVLSGNAAVICIQFNGNPGALTMADDGGNTWTALLGVTGVGGEFFAVFLATNVTPFRTITASMPTHQDFIQAFIDEFNNISLAAGSGALDGAVATGTSAAPNPTLALTATAVDGDLLIGYGACQTIDASVTQFTPNAGWTEIHNNRQNGLFAAYNIQTTHGAVSFGFNTSGTATFDMVALALKAANAGTDPTKLPRILRKSTPIYRNSADSSWTFQITPMGNCLAAMTLAVNSDATISSVSGNVNSWSKKAEIAGGAGGIAAALASDNVAAGTKETVTINFSPATATECKNLAVYDLIGAAFDNAATASGQQLAGGDVTGVSITPTIANGTSLSLIGVNAHTISGSTGASFRYDAPNNPEANGSCGNGFSDNGIAHIDYSSASAITFVWATQANPDGVDTWANVAMTFGLSSGNSANRGQVAGVTKQIASGWV